ncbi:MAG: TPM domain-containing protein [Bryobacteraceae bacterium]
MKCLVRWGAVLALSLAAAFAADFGALKPQGYVSDFSRIIDPRTRAEIEQYCTQLEAATGVELAIVTIPTLQGEPVEEVANILFGKWGIGKKGKDEGLLFLLVTQDRVSRLEVGYGLEPIIPDGFAGSVLREMRPALRQGDYGQALLAGAHTIGSRVAQAKGVEIADAPVRRARRQQPQQHIPWPLVLGGFFALLWLLGGMGRGGPPGGRGGRGDLLTAMLLGSVMGRGSAGWGHRGGGFGGYDSGGFGGFGGFGGGSSGGGGATGRW